jgi:hypothetical protein
MTLQLQWLIATSLIVAGTVESNAEVLAKWRFEEVLKLDRSRSPAVIGESLTGRHDQAVNPRPYSYDESGKGNHLQVWEPREPPRWHKLHCLRK